MDIEMENSLTRMSKKEKHNITQILSQYYINGNVNRKQKMIVNDIYQDYLFAIANGDADKILEKSHCAGQVKKRLRYKLVNKKQNLCLN
jgi:hypothetical protein